MKKINEIIKYLPALPEPLSADVYFAEGENFCYIVDVGNNEQAVQEISSVTKKKIVILSHYHKDHTGNVDKLEYKELYVGDLTYETIQKGIIVTEKMVIQDGIELVIQPCPSPHVKGSLIVTINKEYTLLADLYFTKAGYDKELARQMLQTLEKLDTKYFVVSHQSEKNVFEKQELLERLVNDFFAELSESE
ncbi:MAG: MBL fold metallo-hydrolase [Lachnospiraceae bacterium]|nr:MBL fold metallo-hydrolase [Lachnospiraceae bacterium]